MSEELDPLRQRLIIDDRGYLRGIQRGRRAQQDFESGWTRALRRIGTRLTAAFSTIGILGVGKALVNVNAEMETYAATLKSVLGSQDAALKKLDFVRKFAATTPFQIPDLIQATVRLEAYGIKAENVLRTIGDTAAAMGKDVLQVVEAIADAQTGEFERLKELGIKAIVDQGKTFLLYTDKNGKEQRALIDRNNRAIITSTLEAIWNEKYAGAMEERSRTFQGMVSNLQDVVTESMETIGAGLFQEVKSDVANVLAEINRLKESGELADIGRSIGEGFRGAYRATRTLLKGLVDYGPVLLRLATAWAAFKSVTIATRIALFGFNSVVTVGRVLVGAYQASVYLLAAAKALLTGNTVRATAAMRAFNTVVQRNPITFLIGIVAAIAANMLLFRDNTDEATQALKDQQEAADRLKRSLDDLSGADLFQRTKSLERTALDRVRQEFPSLFTTGQLESLPGAQRALSQQAAILSSVATGQMAVPGLTSEEAIAQLEKTKASLDLVTSAIDAVNKARERGSELLSFQEAQIEDELRQLRDLDRALTDEEQARKAVLETRLKEVHAKMDAAQHDGGGGGGTVVDREQAIKARKALADVRLELQLLAQPNKEIRDLLKERAELLERINELTEIGGVLGMNAVDRELNAQFNLLEVLDERLRKLRLIQRDKGFKDVNESQLKLRQIAPELSVVMDAIAKKYGLIKDDQKDWTKGLQEALEASEAIARALRDIGAPKELVALVEGASGLSGSIGALLDASSPFAAISAGAGVVGAIGGLVSALGGNKEEERRLREALERSRHAMEDFAEQLLAQNTVGGGLSQEDINFAKQAYGALFNPSSGTLTRSGTQNVLSQLVNRGILPESILKDFEDFFKQGGQDIYSFLRDFKIGDILFDTFTRAGTTGTSLGGAERNAGLAGILGTQQDQFQAFLQQFLTQDLGAALRQQLQGLMGVDLSSPQGQQQLRAFVEALVSSLIAGDQRFLGGQITTEDLEKLAELFGQYVTDPASQTEFTKSVQIARSITEIQANELIALTETQLQYIKDIRDAVASGGVGARTINLGPVNVDVPAGVTDPRVFSSQIMEAIEIRLREIQRY